MKQLFLLATGFSLCVLISCNHSEKGEEASDDDSHTSAAATDEGDKMRGMMETVYRAIETGNFEGGADSLFADDIIDHYAPGGREAKGKDSVIAILKGVHNMYSGLKMEILASAYDSKNSTILTLVRVTGKSTANSQGMPANQDFDMKSVDVVKVSNGKATEHWSFDDSAEMMKMMAQKK